MWSKTCKDSSADDMRLSRHISSNATVMIVDDDLRRRSWFLSSMRVPQAYLAHTVSAAVEIIDRIEPNFIALDYDLAPTVDSTPIAENLRAIDFRGSDLIHSENPFGQGVRRIPPSARAQPFGSFDIVRAAIVNVDAQ
jgi:hypothetical protein